MAHGARGTGGDITSGYAPVNGLQMYYEIHGAGQPLVVLHGAYMTIELMGEYIPAFARTRQVIAVELQGHGHTADIDRPITYESLADDTAALLRFLGIDQADVFGYSMGAPRPCRWRSGIRRWCASWCPSRGPSILAVSTTRSLKPSSR